VLNPGPAFVLPVIEPFAVEAQILVFVARHFYFRDSLFDYHTPPFFSKGKVCSRVSFFITTLVFVYDTWHRERDS
jgi:hypothetical protein